MNGDIIIAPSTSERQAVNKITDLQATAGEIDGVVRRGNTIVLLGDSITLNNTEGGLNAITLLNGWFSSGNAIAGHPFEVIKNAGVGGQTSTQILARIDSDVIAYSPSYCTVLCGQNDPSDATGTATIKANIIAIYEKLKTAGIFMFAVTMTPGSGATKNKQVSQVNAWMKQYFAFKPNVEIIDIYTALVDRTNTSGNAISSMVSDGTHLNNKGGFRAGIEVAKVLQKYKTIDFLPSSVMDSILNDTASSNIYRNPLVQGSAGSKGTNVTGIVADTFTTYCTVGSMVASVESRADGIGNNQSFAITSTGWGCIGRLTFPSTYLPVAGEKVYAIAEVTISGGATGLFRVYASLIQNNTEVVADLHRLAGTIESMTSALYIPAEGITITLKTPVFTIATNSTMLEARIDTIFREAGSATVKIGRVAIRKVD